MITIVLKDGPAAGRSYADSEDRWPARMNVPIATDNPSRFVSSWYVPDQYDPIADQWHFRWEEPKHD